MSIELRTPHWAEMGSQQVHSPLFGGGFILTCCEDGATRLSKSHDLSALQLRDRQRFLNAGCRRSVRGDGKRLGFPLPHQKTPAR